MVRARVEEASQFGGNKMWISIGSYIAEKKIHTVMPDVVMGEHLIKQMNQEASQKLSVLPLTRTHIELQYLTDHHERVRTTANNIAKMLKDNHTVQTNYENDMPFPYSTQDKNSQEFSVTSDNCGTVVQKLLGLPHTGMYAGYCRTTGFEKLEYNQANTQRLFRMNT